MSKQQHRRSTDLPSLSDDALKARRSHESRLALTPNAQVAASSETQSNQAQNATEKGDSQASSPDRRAPLDRRAELAADQIDAAEFETGLERRRGVGRRRSDWARAAEEGEMNQEQFLFIKAIDGFKRSNDVMYPTWTDVLEVVRLLGYRKTLASELTISGAEDWTEQASTLSGVRAKPGHPEQRRNVA